MLDYAHLLFCEFKFEFKSLMAKFLLCRLFSFVVCRLMTPDVIGQHHHEVIISCKTIVRMKYQLTILENNLNSSRDAFKFNKC